MIFMSVTIDEDNDIHECYKRLKNDIHDHQWQTHSNMQAFGNHIPSTNQERIGYKLLNKGPAEI